MTNANIRKIIGVLLFDVPRPSHITLTYREMMSIDYQFTPSEVAEDSYGGRIGVADASEEPREVTESFDSPLVDELSGSYIGHWNRLVSQTNWEKGRLILNWREALVAAEVPRQAYSDESWANRVGNVTAQHVGRLRRVFERFGSAYEKYPGLYWSHFHTALDWEDAEMWLEGAIQKSWSVTQMRVQRWEAVGAPEHLKPQESDIFVAEIDEDVNPRNDSPALSTAALQHPMSDRTEGRLATIGAADIDTNTPPFDVDDDKPKKKSKKPKSESLDLPSTEELIADLKNLSGVPSDVNKAVLAMKSAIFDHKLSGWQEISATKMLRLLEGLKALTMSVDAE